VNIAANFSLVEATSRSPGSFSNRLARRPQENVNLSADWQTPIGISIGTTITLTGDAFDNLANTRRLDGYALVGLRAAYNVNDRIQLFGRVENLGDEDYQTTSGFNSLGRNAYAGVRVKI
jgi:vitamin B12 transporter